MYGQHAAPQYRLGSTVSIDTGGGTPIKGMVNAFLFEYGGHVSYRVSWWADNQRYTQWLESFEISEAEEM